MNLTSANNCAKLYNYLTLVIRPEQWTYETVRKLVKNGMVVDSGQIVCETVGCALGWCPSVFPEDFKLMIYGPTKISVKFHNENLGTSEEVIDFFGVTDDEFDKLFWGRDCEEYYGKDFDKVTPKDVARKLKEVVNKYGYELVAE